MSASTWQRYVLPAVTFMSVVIGGGYATGRELAEFFMPAGPLGGLLGMLLTAVVWSVVFGLSLELARCTRSFEYRAFFQQLLGPAWVLFEIVYLALLLLILAVLGAAAGEIVGDITGAATQVGSIVFIASIAALSWFGTAAVERFFSIWGVVLYVAYAVFFVTSLTLFHDRIGAVLHAANVEGGWVSGGLAYAGYNLAAAPALLFCARHQLSRRETLTAGALAGPVAMLPGALFFIAMLAYFPSIIQAPVPLQVLLRAIDSQWLSVGMQIAIFGTLVQTGIGVLHGFTERVAATRPQWPAARSRRLRLVISAVLSIGAIFLASRIGLIDLISKGYGYLAWIFVAIYIVPLLTVGVWRIWGMPACLPAAHERA